MHEMDRQQSDSSQGLTAGWGGGLSPHLSALLSLYSFSGCFLLQANLTAGDRFSKLVGGI